MDPSLLRTSYQKKTTRIVSETITIFTLNDYTNDCELYDKDWLQTGYGGSGLFATEAGPTKQPYDARMSLHAFSKNYLQLGFY